jgi:diguanylate cyclase (GGDEF)-like protein
MSWIDAVHHDDRERVRSMYATIGESGEIRQDYRIVKPHGGIRWLRAQSYVVPAAQGMGTRLVGTSTDVTVEHEARELLGASEARYRDLAMHDPMTGLANRGLFNDRLERLLAGRTPANGAAVIMVDVDGFKGVNDAFGHGVGDDLLIEIARRLLACTREEDTVARLGGDEFAIVMTSDDEQGALRCGERVAEALSRPYDLATRIVQCSASVGVAVHAAPEESVEALLLRADVALYGAKDSGGAQCVVYDAKLEASARLRSELAADLPGVLAEL